MADEKDNQDYEPSTGNTTMYEMQGLIPLLNSAASQAEVQLRGTHIRKMDIESARVAVWDFYTYLGALVHNAYEILEPRLIEQYDNWWNRKYPDPLYDSSHFNTGLRLSKAIQKDLWLKGIKDTNRSQSLPFPCEVYREVSSDGQ